jgi:predicted metal-binding protein
LGRATKQKLELLCKEALSLGAARAQAVPTSRLVVREAARAKCFVPLCRFYGSSAMCPPHNPLTPDVTRRILREYAWGVLFQLEARVEDFVGEGWRSRHLQTELRQKEMVARLEAQAFYMGFPLAMGFAAGECSLCLPLTPCAVLRGEPCAHPLRARPAMEACGFDVFAIAESLGWPLVPIGHSSRVEEVKCASLTGLVLVA